MKHDEIEERNLRILELTATEHTPKEIAEILGMKYNRVLQILHNFGIKPYYRSKCDTGTTAQKVIAMLKDGIMQSDIARELKVSRQYVSQVKKRHEALMALL